MLQQSSKLSDSIRTAQMTKEIEDKVMMTTQDSADRLKQESGVEPSLTYREIKTYVDKVLEEVAKVKVKKSNVNVVLS